MKIFIFYTIRLIIFVFTISIFVVPFSDVQSVTLTPTPSLQTITSAEELPRVTRLKERARKEIDRRTTSLIKLITRINATKRLSEENKKNLVKNIQQEITNLTILRGKIDATSDIDGLKQEIQSVVAEYNAFAFYVPQMHLLASSDSLGILEQQLRDLHTKLDLRASQAEITGENISLLGKTIESMYKNISEASILSEEATSLVLDLLPDGYPGNKTVLRNAREKLRTARERLRTARKNAQTIRMKLLEFSKTAKPLENATSSGR